MPQDKLTAVRLKQKNGQYGPQIPVGANSSNIIYKNTQYNLDEILGNVRTNIAPLQEQIDNIDTSAISEAVTDWLGDNPGALLPTDKTLSVAEVPADAQQAGKLITINNETDGQATKLHLNTTNQMVSIATMEDVPDMTQIIASAYSPSTVYAIGDHVFYNGILYKCTTAITTAEAWTAAHWTAVRVESEIADLKNNVDMLIPIDLADGVTTVPNRYIDYQTGDEAKSNNAFCTDLIDITGITTILYSRYYTTSTTNRWATAFYDANGEFILDSGIRSSLGNETAYYELYAASVPNGAKYVRISGANALGPVSLYDKATYNIKVYPRLEEAEKDIDDLKIQMNQRGIPSGGSTSQSLRKKSGTNYDMEWADVGLPTDEQTADAVDAWMAQHSGSYVIPDGNVTTEKIHDGAVTEAKFSDTLKLKTIKEYYTPEMFGAVGDGDTDDSAAIQYMIDNVPEQSVCIFQNNYYCGSGLLVTRPINIIMYGRCRFPNTIEYAFRVLGNGSRRNKFRLNLSTVAAWETSNIIGLDLWAAQENEFDVWCDGFKTGIRLLAGRAEGNTDCDYNKIFIRRIYNCQYAIYFDGLSDDDPSSSLNSGTASQNVFIGGRVGVQGSSYKWLGDDETNPDNSYWAVRTSGARLNSCNSFLAVSFEGFGNRGTEDNVDYTNRAKVTTALKDVLYLNCRFEGITYLGADGISGTGSSLVLGGYGAGTIYDGKDTIFDDNKNQISLGTSPLTLRVAPTGDKEYLSFRIANSNDTVAAKYKDDTFYTPKLAMIPNGGYYGTSTSSNSAFISFAYGNNFNTPQKIKSSIAAKEWKISEIGHIISKNMSNKVFDIQPIYTEVPSFDDTIPTGMMVFDASVGKPKWYDGTKWVWADGTAVT